MSQIQYLLNVGWDSTLVAVGTVSNIAPTSPINGMAESAIKTTTGAPATNANRFIPGALIKNAISGVVYQNTGSTASPVWSPLENAGSGFTLPIAETDSTTTTTTSFSLTFSALTSGVGSKLTGSGATMTTNGIVDQILMGASTLGAGQSISTTGIYVGTGIRKLTALAATSGILDLITGGGASMSAAGVCQKIDMGAATAGTAQNLLTSGVYVGITGIRSIDAALATTGILDRISAAGLISGIARQTILAAANLTTGRYESYNDGALEVHGIGANGHQHFAQTTAPAIAVQTANGISAAAITAGGTDVCGQITTTGTNDNVGATVLRVTFNKTYTVAPKSIQLTPLNVAGAKVAGTTLVRPWVTNITATTFDITIPADAGALATPSWCYQVFA